MGESARKFAKEVGIIVLGVLIALGLGKVADDLSWQSQVGHAQSALAVEISESVGQGIDRMRAMPCVERRLDELASSVDTASSAGRLPPVPPTDWPPFHTYPSGAWESTLSSQTAARFSREQINRLAALYRFTALAEAAGQRETEIWARLSALVGPGRAFSDSEEASARQLLSEARFYNRYMAGMGLRLQQHAARLQIELDERRLNDRRTRPLSNLASCRPRQTQIPDAYGQGIWETMLKDVESGLRR